MRKRFLLILVIGSFCSAGFAQVDKSFYRSSYESRNNGTFNSTTSLITLGLGFPNRPQPYFGGSRFSLGPIYAKYEHGLIRDEVGIGGYIAFSQGWFKVAGENYSVTAFSVAFLGYYHFNKLIPVKKLDAYAGAGFSIRSVGYSFDDAGYSSDEGTIVNGIIKVGVRYYLTPTFAIYAESGYDNMSDVNLGITFRM